MARDLKVGLPITMLAAAVALAAETGAPLGDAVRVLLDAAAADAGVREAARAALLAGVEVQRQREQEAQDRRAEEDREAAERHARGQALAAQALEIGRQKLTGRAKGHAIAAENVKLGKVKAAKPRRETAAAREERLDAEGALRAKRHRVWQVASSWSHEKQRDATPVEMRAWWMPRWRHMGASEATWEGGTWGLSPATEAEDRAFAEEAVRTYVPAPEPR